MRNLFMCVLLVTLTHIQPSNSDLGSSSSESLSDEEMIVVSSGAGPLHTKMQQLPPAQMLPRKRGKSVFNANIEDDATEQSAEGDSLPAKENKGKKGKTKHTDGYSSNKDHKMLFSCDPPRCEPCIPAVPDQYGCSNGCLCPDGLNPGNRKSGPQGDRDVGLENRKNKKSKPSKNKDGSRKRSVNEDKDDLEPLRDSKSISCIPPCFHDSRFGCHCPTSGKDRYLPKQSRINWCPPRCYQKPDG